MMARFYGPWGGWYFWPMRGLLWMVVIGLLAAGLVMLLRRRDGAAGAPTAGLPAEPAEGAPATPLDVAKMRYARGEITKDEFEALKADLQ